MTEQRRSITGVPLPIHSAADQRLRDALEYCLERGVPQGLTTDRRRPRG